MNKLWTFGDSFTAGHGCTPQFEYYQKYYKEGDKLWVELLADELNLELSNIGRNGASNDQIIDLIILNWKKIKQNDFVVIGKTFSHRFDVPVKTEKSDTDTISNRWYSIGISERAFQTIESSTQVVLDNLNELDETIINFNYYFAANPLYKERQDLRYNFLINELEEKQIKVYLWDIMSSHRKLKFNTIQIDTKNEIDDGHFSFKGHVEFYKWISKKIKNENKII